MVELGIKRPAARTEHCHPDDTALQVDECAAFGSGAECQVQTNEAVDGSTSNAVPSPTRQSDDTECGERLAVMVPNCQDHLANPQSGIGGRRHRKSVRLETKHSHIGGGVAARKRSIGDAAARKRQLDVVVALQDFFGGDDDSGTPMNAARGPPPSAMDSDDGACGAFDKFRDVVRECEKGTAGFDHDHFSKKNCLVAIWHQHQFPSTGRTAGPELPESSQGDLSKASVLGGAHELGGAREPLDEER